jgi:hypothetical protein
MKKQLTIWLAIFSLLPLLSVAHDNKESLEFKQYLKQQDKEFSDYKQTIDKEFAQFVAAWKLAEDEYKEKSIN